MSYTARQNEAQCNAMRNTTPTPMPRTANVPNREFVSLFCHFLQEMEGVGEERVRGENFDHRVEADGPAREAVSEDELEGVEGARHKPGFSQVPEKKKMNRVEKKE